MNEQHVAALVAEVFGHGQAGQGHAQAHAGRLVHLAEDHHRAVDHAGFVHFAVELRAFAGALAHAGEHRVAVVELGDGVDQLLDDDRLAHARAAEDAGLAALGERRDQVDDLDAGLENFDAGPSGLRTSGAGRWMGYVISVLAAGRPSIGVAQHVEDAAQRLRADGTLIGAPVLSARPRRGAGRRWCPWPRCARS